MLLHYDKKINIDRKIGKLIVIDGIDGSGKTTQVELLSKYLKENNISFEVVNFPKYESFYGQLIKRYLEGEFGKSVNSYLVAPIFAADRLLAKPLIENWLSEGKIIIANRYVSASKAHLGANLEENEKENFMEWIDQLEYQTNNIPKPDITILLKIDPKTGQMNALKDQLKDIHEESSSHEEKAAKIYLELSKAEENWKVVECMEDGKLKSKETINKLLVEILSSIL